MMAAAGRRVKVIRENKSSNKTEQGKGETVLAQTFLIINEDQRRQRSI